MKQISLLAVAVTSLFSVPSYAVEDGVSLSWSKYPYLVESQCTGTVLAGNKVLLAGHCFDVNHAVTRTVNLYNQKQTTGVSINTLLDPSIPDAKKVDIALWTLSSTVPMNEVAFIANLDNTTDNPKVGDTVSFIGFGQRDHIPKLTKAENTIVRLSTTRFDYSGIAHSVPGDSGAPVFNINNKIVGINTVGDDGTIDLDGKPISGGVQIVPIKNWLLKSVNTWHSPTELKFTGDKTIEIQSLHVKNANLATRQNNGTLATGDVTVTGGSCITDGDVAPFGICTLELSSTGGEGHIILDDGNTVTINRAPKPAPKPEPQPSNDGGSGGSMGYLSLLGLLALAFQRKKH